MPAGLVVCVGLVQVLGLAALGWTRMSERSSREPFAQLLFFALLSVVAVTAVVTVALGNVLWPVCSVTFGVMIVGATLSSHKELEAVV